MPRKRQYQPRQYVCAIDYTLECVYEGLIEEAKSRKDKIVTLDCTKGDFLRPVYHWNVEKIFVETQRGLLQNLKQSNVRGNTVIVFGVGALLLDLQELAEILRDVPWQSRLRLLHPERSLRSFRKRFSGWEECATVFATPSLLRLDTALLWQRVYRPRRYRFEEEVTSWWLDAEPE